MFFYPGAYKNFDELEEYLTRDELIKMYEKVHEIRKEDKKFAAALKGIDIDEGVETDFDRLKRRAEAKALNMDEEKYELRGIVQIIDEDEEESETE